jgi:hypothetical protein
LRITLTFATCSFFEVNEQRTLITTTERLQPIINSIWSLEYSRIHPPGAKLHINDLNLRLNFYPKSKSRYETLSSLLLKLWEDVNGFKRLALKGDIGESMRKRLANYNLRGPFPNIVATRLKEYFAITKLKLEEKDYLAVRMVREYNRRISDLSS